MLRIVDEHPGGNIIGEHGKTNRWLRAAIARRELAGMLAGVAEAVPCVLRRFVEAARSIGRGGVSPAAGSR
jgi:hypothetical protein